MQTPRHVPRTPRAAVTVLPLPRRGSRWRWSPTTSQRVLMGGGVLTAVLGMGSVGAGAATTAPTKPTPGAVGGAPPGLAKPTAAGKVTALSGDSITIQNRDATAETVLFSPSTTFRAMSAPTTASALKLGDFIAVNGTKNTDGTVTATSIMAGPPLGPGGPGGPRGGKQPAGRATPPKGATGAAA